MKFKILDELKMKLLVLSFSFLNFGRISLRDGVNA